MTKELRRVAWVVRFHGDRYGDSVGLRFIDPSFLQQGPEVAHHPE